MLFSSMIFLWLFLPFVLIVNLILPHRISNWFLMAASFIFYAWGEQEYIWLLLVSLLVNFYGAHILGCVGSPAQSLGCLSQSHVSQRHVSQRHVSQNIRPFFFALLLAVNLGFLGYFKYFDFFTGLLGRLAGRELMAPRNLLLPIGISFYTFQMISYIVDVYRGDIEPEKKLSHLALYISFFPKMIQGPIVRYRGFGACIETRHVTPETFAYGARRFIYGLAKKLILANQFGSIVDKVLSSPMEQISGGLGWYIGVLYTLQIYYDFSGYSDMAVGIGKMLGFYIPENFNYPYLARNVGEFWRRWHISLSSWFKDYLYIPLGGSRRGRARTCVNLMAVFLCTGFWHGAGLSFLAWGIYYGCLQILERLFLKKFLDRFPGFFSSVISYIYMFFVTVVGWTMFRADSLTRGMTLLRQMFFLKPGIYDLSMFVTHKTTVCMMVGFLICGPVQKMLPGLARHMLDEDSVSLTESMGLILLFAYSMAVAAGSTYNPFIYFRF